MNLARKMTMVASLIAISAGSAMAGFATPSVSGITSNSARGVGAGVVGTGNGTVVYNHAGPEFTPGIINVTGTLVSVDAGTWSSEARIEVCNPSVCIFSGALPGTTGATFTTLNINANLNSGGLLTGTSIGNWTFEFFESYNDPGNPDARWDNLTITVQDSVPPPPPPPSFASVGNNFTSTPNSLTLGNKAFGTTIWDNNNPQPGLTDGAGELANNTRYNGSAFDQVGNEVGYQIIHGGGDLFVDLLGIASDLDLILLDSTGIPLTGTLDASENGGTTAEHVELLGAAAGTYYAVVDTFGSTNTGSAYSITYTPEPATLTLLAFGVVGLIRRRR